jgi:hypothetical protein
MEKNSNGEWGAAESRQAPKYKSQITNELQNPNGEKTKLRMGWIARTRRAMTAGGSSGFVIFFFLL